MSNYQYEEGLIDFSKPTVAVSTFYEKRFLHGGMMTVPIAVFTIEGDLGYLPLTIMPTSTKSLTYPQALALKASINFFQVLADRYNIVCYDGEEVLKIIGNLMPPETRVYPVKDELAKVIGEYENGQLKIFTQSEAVERIDPLDSDGLDSPVGSAAWVLHAFLWAVKKKQSNTTPSFHSASKCR